MRKGWNVGNVVVPLLIVAAISAPSKAQAAMDVFSPDAIIQGCQMLVDSSAHSLDDAVLTGVCFGLIEGILKSPDDDRCCVPVGTGVAGVLKSVLPAFHDTQLLFPDASFEDLALLTIRRVFPCKTRDLYRVAPAFPGGEGDPVNSKTKTGKADDPQEIGFIPTRPFA